MWNVTKNDKLLRWSSTNTRTKQVKEYLNIKTQPERVNQATRTDYCLQTVSTYRLMSLKPGFHYPSWRHGPSTRLVETRARQHGPSWRVMETGHPSTRAVNSGSGNRALGYWDTKARYVGCCIFWQRHTDCTRIHDCKCMNEQRRYYTVKVFLQNKILRWSIIYDICRPNLVVDPTYRQLGYYTLYMSIIWRISTGVLNCHGLEAQDQDNKCMTKTKTKTVKTLSRDFPSLVVSRPNNRVERPKVDDAWYVEWDD